MTVRTLEQRVGDYIKLLDSTMVNQPWNNTHLVLRFMYTDFERDDVDAELSKQFADKREKENG